MAEAKRGRGRWKSQRSGEKEDEYKMSHLPSFYSKMRKNDKGKIDFPPNLGPQMALSCPLPSGTSTGVKDGKVDGRLNMKVNV